MSKTVILAPRVTQGSGRLRYQRITQFTSHGDLPLRDLPRRKESNNEDAESDLIHSAQEVYTEYPDPRRDERRRRYYRH